MNLPELQSNGTVADDFVFEIPEYYNFGFDVIDKRAQENDKTAFIAVDRTGTDIQHYSFSDLSKSSNQFANALLQLGCKTGDYAFVMIPRLPSWYTVMIGCCKTGIVPMPATNLLMPKDIEYRVTSTKAKIAIVSAENADKIDQIRAKCPTIKHFIVIDEPREGWLSFDELCEEASEEFDRSRVEPSKSTDLMLLFFTSGTTANPKMVARDHSYALAHTLTGKYWMDLSEDDVHITLSDTGWAKAAWGMLYAPWQMGATIVLYNADPHFDAEAHLNLLETLNVTTFCGPPTVYRVFAQMDLSQFNLSSVRHSMGAGEPLNPEVISIWNKATGGLIYDGYGQTESVNMVANFPAMDVRPGSMGKPVPGLDVQIIDDDGNPVPVDEVGHIGVRITEPYPPGLFREYWQAPKATAQAFRNGWYYTGDTATVDADGYLWFVGRSDDIITSSGYRISPFEVESTLLEHPSVMESAVVSKPDDVRGEIVLAFIILADGYEASDELTKEIQNFVKTQTAPYKYPRKIIFRDALPKTISGKIRRVELRDEAIQMDQD